MKSKLSKSKKKLIDKLVRIANPRMWHEHKDNNLSTYIQLTNDIATDIIGWDSPGKCYQYIETSGRAIDDNIRHLESIDLDTVMATLICIHREQYWSDYHDTITPRIDSGQVQKLTLRLVKLLGVNSKNGGNMSNIHYFPRYSQKENMVTNSTLLLFSRLYNNSTDKFRRFINAIIEESGLMLDTIVQFKQQYKIAGGTTPDGVIEQESFKVVIETKLYGHQSIAQIKGHLSAFENEDKKVFLWINKDPITPAYHQDILDAINNSGKKDIGFASTTFKEICSNFRDVIEVFDVEMNALIEDYEAFCNESGLIENIDSRIRVVLTGHTYDQNLQYSMYYQPQDRGYQSTKYIGLYRNKKVNAIGEITCIVDAHYDINNNKCVIDEIIEGQPPADFETTIADTYTESHAKYGYLLTDLRRYFFVDGYSKTEFIKNTKGAIMGTRYIDLSEINGYSKSMGAKDIAQLLNGKIWDV